MSAVDAALYELGALNDFQKQVYRKVDKSDEGDVDKVGSDFCYEPSSSTWYTKFNLKLNKGPSSVGEDGLYTIKYMVNPSFHRLISTNLRFTLPAACVRDEFVDRVQICWPKYIGNNVVVIASFNHDNLAIQTMDNVWYNFETQLRLRDSSFRGLHNRLVGNVPFLTEWTTKLPQYSINVPQPWYYSKHRCFAFPIFLTSPDAIPYHEYSFRLNIAQLLRMRIKTSKGEWKKIPFNSKYVIGVGDKLPDPDLWGKYGYKTDWELDYNKNCSEHVYYIENVITCDSETNEKYGKELSASLECDTTCKAIFWAAENVDATGERNYSNFTTNTDDIDRGWNPIQNLSIKYNTLERFKGISSDTFDGLEVYHGASSVPCDQGYNMYALSNDLNSTNIEVGLSFDKSKTKFSVKLGDTNPYLIIPTPNKKSDDNVIDEDDTNNQESKEIVALSPEVPKEEIKKQDNSPNFMLRVRLLVLKRLTIKYDDDKKKYRFSLT